MAVLVGKKAPLFEADAVVNGGEFVEKFSLEQYIGKKHVVFFFYPMDFTFVCPTELLAFQEKIEAFEEHKYQLYAQFLLFPEVDEIILLKYRPQFDDNPFDVRPVLDESRGLKFVFTRQEMGDMLQVVEDRVRFADEYLKSGQDLEMINKK